MKVLDIEKKIGIKSFLTLFRGIGGKLRLHPEDFIVQEVSNFPTRYDSGKFLIKTI